MDRGAWRATVHGVTNSWTQLSDFNKSSSRKEYVCVLVTQSCPTLQPDGLLQTPLSIEFSRQKYWIGLPFPSPGDLPDPGLNPGLSHCGQILYHLSYLGSPYVGKRSQDIYSFSSLHVAAGWQWLDPSTKDHSFSPAASPIAPATTTTPAPLL